MEFFSQEYQRELPFPSPGYFPNPGMEPRSPTLQADSLPSESHRVKILLFKSLTHTLLSRLQGIPLRGLITSLVGKIPWRREWQPTPVFLPGESHGQRNLVDYSPRGHKELDKTEQHTLSLCCAKAFKFDRSHLFSFAFLLPWKTDPDFSLNMYHIYMQLMNLKIPGLIIS